MTHLSDPYTAPRRHHVRPSTQISRDTLLAQLTPTEAALVRTAEAEARVPDGKEYIDLHHLDRGVRKANCHGGTLRSVLPREGLDEALWVRVTEHVPPRP